MAPQFVLPNARMASTKISPSISAGSATSTAPPVIFWAPTAPAALISTPSILYTCTISSVSPTAQPATGRTQQLARTTGARNAIPTVCPALGPPTTSAPPVRMPPSMALSKSTIRTCTRPLVT